MNFFFVSFTCWASAQWILAWANTCDDLQCPLRRLDLWEDDSISYLQQHAKYVGEKAKELETLHDKDTSVGKRGNVAVCITGQVARLEIESKVKNVLIALSEQQYFVHVFVALETGEGQYVNEETAGVEVELTKAEVEAGFQPFYQTGLFHPHVNYTAHISRWTTNYLSDKRQSMEERQERLASHMSQHANLKACVDLIEKRESQIGIRYDVVLKLRDNTLVPMPYTLTLAQDIVDEKTAGNPVLVDRKRTGNPVLVKECRAWGGINDKVMLVPREHLRIALAGPYMTLMGVEKGNRFAVSKFARDWKITSPEILYKRVLQVHKIPFLPVNASVLPFLDARCHSRTSSGTTRWCPVPDTKDCWPPHELWNIKVPTNCAVKHNRGFGKEKKQNSGIPQRFAQLSIYTCSLSMSALVISIIYWPLGATGILKILLYILLGSTVTLSVKLVYNDEFGFHFPKLMTTCHLIASAMFGFMVLFYRKHSQGQDIKIPTASEFGWNLLPMCLGFTYSLGCANMSLMYCSVAFAAIIGASTPFFSIALITLLGMPFHWELLLPVSGIVFGCMATVMGTLQFSVYGFVLLLLSNLGRAVKAVLQQRLLTGEVKEKFDPMTLLAWQCLICCPLMLLWSVFSEGSPAIAALVQQRQSWAFLAALALSCANGAALNALHILVIKDLGAVGIQATAQLKQGLTALGGVLLFGDAFTPLTVAGGGIVLLSAFWFTRVEAQIKNEETANLQKYDRSEKEKGEPS
mmetsp:Transcript_130575/g.240168  ORF Transcript_130575/g.240168 Transcript_130575/m.240168 type:complete len:749 (-) Transcript_130575:96-2342(-)